MTGLEVATLAARLVCATVLLAVAWMVATLLARTVRDLWYEVMGTKEDRTELAEMWLARERHYQEARRTRRTRIRARRKHEK